MYFSILSIVALATASSVTLGQSSGCGKDIPASFPQPGLNTTVTLGDREFQLFIPAHYEKSLPAPVYFSYHGASRDMYEEIGLSQFSNPEFNKDGIAVYPNSKNGYWLSNPKANVTRPNDLDFTNDVLTYLEESLCVDTTRVYAGGKSNGGGMVGVLACNATVGARFAAFAAVSGAWYNTTEIDGVGTCAPLPREEGYPFLEFHGVIDTTAPIDGKNATHPKLAVIDILEQWAELNGCPKGAEWASNETVFTEPLVKHASWNCGGKNGIVQHYREGDNGHCWPSTVSNDDYVRLAAQCPLGHYVFNATEYIFDFFSHHQLNP
ncbi:hypothetical protein N7495_003599 [Penicillium taxi]|uniref:uncharacterized protein n=1 Tax=Penicillium taxi TaxID=168475 RepID=UPI002545B63A|nr:uncharacterized protein N7495_003599 [Penicillium taxi]KAJ5898855.1 hypothetical protein N7495_003599 [Penicillium taxi]